MKNFIVLHKTKTNDKVFVNISNITHISANIFSPDNATIFFIGDGSLVVEESINEVMSMISKKEAE